VGLDLSKHWNITRVAHIYISIKIPHANAIRAQIFYWVKSYVLRGNGVGFGQKMGAFWTSARMVLGVVCHGKKWESKDGFRTIRVSGFKVLYYIHMVCNMLLLCLSQIAQPIMHTTNPYKLQRHAKSLKMLV
jgi:hypothetical protein